jgi:hypothetical protein
LAERFHEADTMPAPCAARAKTWSRCRFMEAVGALGRSYALGISQSNAMEEADDLAGLFTGSCPHQRSVASRIITFNEIPFQKLLFNTIVSI